MPVSPGSSGRTASWTSYARLVAFGGGTLLGLGVLPIALKWLLIGRWKPRAIRAWSLGYFRFWLVKTVVVANPMARMFVGTPLYTLYLRALGARIGRGATILTQAHPGLYRPADHRRGQPHHQGHVHQLLPRPGGADRDWPRHPRRGLVHRRAARSSTSIPRSATGAARARVRPALRPDGPAGRDLARLSRRAGPGRHRLPGRAARPLRRAAPGLALRRPVAAMLAVAGPVEAAAASLLLTHSRVLPACSASHG